MPLDPAIPDLFRWDEPTRQLLYERMTAIVVGGIPADPDSGDEAVPPADP